MVDDRQTGTETVRQAARMSDLNLLPRRIYPFRVLGMGLGGVPIAAVLLETGAGWPTWVLLIGTCLLWPHLALVLTRISQSPFRAELRNLMVDSAIAGLWVALMHFNLLPSVVLLTVAIVDKINAGVRGLWLWSLPGMIGAIILGGLITGFRFQPETSMAVILACMPMLLIHTVAVTLNSYRLIRKVQRQNRQLDELSRVDRLTGLASRGHWQARAEVMLQDHHAGAGPASLLLIDLDHFKEINDRYGHTVGDDALRGVTAVIRDSLERHDIAGRFGGDELAVAIEGDAERARALAEAICAGVASLDLPHLEGRNLSVSIGFAEAGEHETGLREWLESADQALYRAKDAGRNQVAGSSPDTSCDSERLSPA